MTKSWLGLAGTWIVLGSAFWVPASVNAQEEVTLDDHSVVLATDLAGRLVPVDGSEAPPDGARRYWADPATGTIRRGLPDGTAAEDVLTGLNVPYGLGFDPVSGALVWTSSGDEAVQRLAVGDLRSTTLRTEFEEPYAIVVGVEGAQTVYGVEAGEVVALSEIESSETERRIVLLRFDPELDPVHGLALDETAGVLYVGDGNGMMTRRIQIDTREVQNLAYVAEAIGNSKAGAP